MQSMDRSFFSGRQCPVPSAPVPRATSCLLVHLTVLAFSVSGVSLVGFPRSVIGQEPGKPPSARQAATAPGDVLVDSSRVFVFVGKKGLGHEHAIVGHMKSGHVHLGAGKNAGTLTFAMKSFRADTADARKYLGLAGETDAGTQASVTANMLGKDVLDVDTYPEATFTIRSAKREQPQEGKEEVYLLEGDFKLHGVSQPLSFEATAVRSKGKVRLRGHFPILQTDFGITPYSKGFGVIGVANQLRIYGEIDLVAE